MQLNVAHIQYIQYHQGDLWSLDAEGAELSVLQTVDFGKVNMSVLMIENAEDDRSKGKQEKTTRMHNLLKANKLHPFARTGQSDKCPFKSCTYKSEVWVSHSVLISWNFKCKHLLRV